jgi:alpha-N-arabinofuranosidase
VVHDAASKQLVVNVVNRSAEKAIPTTIENQWGNLGTSATVTEVNSASLTDENSVNEQKVRPVERSIAVKGNTISYTFPAHSFTQLIIKTAF